MKQSTFKTEQDLHEAVYRHRMPSVSSITGFSVALLAIMVGLLVGRPMPAERVSALCLYQINLVGPTRLLLNCDANEFMTMANDPSSLFEAGAIRQSRPAFILSGYLGSFLTAPVAKLLQPFVPQSMGDAAVNVEKAEGGLKTLLPVYLSYILLNVVLIVVSFILYFAALRRTTAGGVGPETIVLTLVGILLAGNDVVKAFIWSPHTQMLNIFVPMLCCWLLAHPRVWPVWSLVFWSLAIATGLLAYPAFAIVIPCLLGSQLLARREHRLPWLGLRGAAEALLVLAVSGAPAMIWAMLLHRIAGSVSFNEVSQYNQVVWIFHAWREGPHAFVSAVWKNTWFFVSNTLLQAIPALAVVLCSAFAVSFTSSGVRRWLADLGPAIRATLPVSLICLIFFTIIGWPAARLAFPAVTPLIVLAGAAAVTASHQIAPSRQRQFVTVIAAIAVAWSVLSVIKAGPLS